MNPWEDDEDEVDWCVEIGHDVTYWPRMQMTITGDVREYGRCVVCGAPAARPPESFVYRFWRQ